MLIGAVALMRYDVPNPSLFWWFAAQVPALCWIGGCLAVVVFGSRWLKRHYAVEARQ